MTPAAFIDRALTVPHVPGRGDWRGADCWGIVELWYREILSVELVDRADHAPGVHGLEAGVAGSDEHWTRVEEPQDHCLVVMRAGPIKAGHIGVYYGDSILHSSHHHGCVYQRLETPALRRRRTAYLKRK